LDQTKVVIFIQVLNSFVSGVLGVVLPLMMTGRGIDIVTIGLVFASLPLIFQFGRMFFATVSDFWGRKLFFLSNGCLNVASSLIFYLARTPLEFIFGKITEGTKDGSLWAVNRAFLMDSSKKKWTILVYLRTTVYVSYAVGSLLALMLCALIGGLVIPVSMLLIGERKRRFSAARVLHLLDFRKKNRVFKVFLILFFVMGLSFGFRSGFVFPLFLSANGFNAETIGLLLGLQILLAGLFSYLFVRRFGIGKLILVSGGLYTVALISLGFSSSALAAILAVSYGIIEGLLSITQEGILSRISSEGSYGTDIGLLMTGLHVGNTLSLAMSGFLISRWGFAVPFLLSALIFSIFYVSSYLILKE